MNRSRLRNSELLTLRELSGSVDVARRLPRELAFQLHALPVAEDTQGVTVAMSDPSDLPAIDAIAEALGAEPWVVRGESETIDARLAEVWSIRPDRDLRLLVLRQPDSAGMATLAFASYLSQLVGASTRQLTVTGRASSIVAAVNAELAAEAADLVVTAEPGESWVRRLLAGTSAGSIIGGVGRSCLVVRRPNWPIQAVLFIMAGSPPDLRAADWAVRLARPSGASVTVMPVVPYLPSVPGVASRLVSGMPMLLTWGEEEGRILRQVAGRLTGCGVEGALRLRQGAPDRQVRAETARHGYDLVIVGSKPNALHRFWSSDDLPVRVLRWTTPSVLIAK